MLFKLSFKSKGFFAVQNKKFVTYVQECPKYEKLFTEKHEIILKMPSTCTGECTEVCSGTVAHWPEVGPCLASVPLVVGGGGRPLPGSE